MPSKSKRVDNPRPYLDELQALRAQCLKVIALLLIVFASLLPFADNCYEWIASPLLEQMPFGSSIIATTVTGAILAPIKLCMFLALIITLPVSFYLIWQFIAPGLYPDERRAAFWFAGIATGLFYLGMAFAYYIVAPIVFDFIIDYTPEAILVAPDATAYLSFILKLFFAFGLCFEVPIITLCVIKSGITTAQSLAEKRRFVIVFAFVIGMLLTPPDVISQLLLAIPMWLLFELGLLLARWLPGPVLDKAKG